MPKKVITRRQRKAAEAKRQHEENVLPKTSAKQKDTKLEAALNLRPSCSGVKLEPKAAAAATGKELPKDNPPKVAATAETVKKVSGKKTTLTIIVNDKKMQTDKEVFDLLSDDNFNKKINNNIMPAVATQPPAAPAEQGSFSKSLTKRAAATFTKIQKLSKVFNKMNFKQPAAQVPDTEAINVNVTQLDETMNTALNGSAGSSNQNKACGCEFCKVVLNQLLVGKKRDKKLSKRAASKRSLAQRRRSVSPGQNLAARTAPQLEPKCCKDCELLPPPTGAARRRLVKMLERKDKQLDKNVVKKIKQLKKQSRNMLLQKQQQKQQTVQQYETTDETEKHGQRQLQQQAQQKQQEKQQQHKSTTAPEVLKPTSIVLKPLKPMKALPKPLKTLPKPLPDPNNNKKPSRAKFIMKPPIPQAAPPVDALPIKIFGKSGYFVLTGTDAQLDAQLKKLTARNVRVKQCVVLEPGVYDHLEHQLEELEKNREQILQRMRNKEDMMAPRRQRRSKQPSKYS